MAYISQRTLPFQKFKMKLAAIFRLYHMEESLSQQYMRKATAAIMGLMMQKKNHQRKAFVVSK